VFPGNKFKEKPVNFEVRPRMKGFDLFDLVPPDVPKKKFCLFALTQDTLGIEKLDSDKDLAELMNGRQLRVRATVTKFKGSMLYTVVLLRSRPPDISPTGIVCERVLPTPLSLTTRNEAKEIRDNLAHYTQKDIGEIGVCTNEGMFQNSGKFTKGQVRYIYAVLKT
jgi:hypothetical protein